jgi:hypothetical protein
MASRFTFLSVTLALVTVVATGCGRTPLSNAGARSAAALNAQADGGDEPCDLSVAAKLNAFRGAMIQEFRRPAVKVDGGPDKPAVIEIASPNKSARSGGAASPIGAIVLHHTASPADARRIGGFFSQPSAQVSAHFTVDRTGYIVQSVPETEASWHAGRSKFAGRDNVNDFSIGIEICNIGDSKEAYPEAQYKALGELVAYLMTKHDLGWNRLTRHRDVAIPLGRKTDTSDNFSRKALEAAVVEAGGPAPAAEPATGLAFPNIN